MGFLEDYLSPKLDFEEKAKFYFLFTGAIYLVLGTVCGFFEDRLSKTRRNLFLASLSAPSCFLVAYFFTEHNLILSIFLGIVCPLLGLWSITKKPEKAEKARFRGSFTAVPVAVAIFLYFKFGVGPITIVSFIVGFILSIGGGMAFLKYKDANPSANQAIHAAFTSITALVPAAFCYKISRKCSIGASIFVVAYSLACGVGSYFYLKSKEDSIDEKV